MRSWPVAVAAAALCGVLSVGPRVLEAQGAQQTPTFRSTTSLVLVDVTVLDKDGKPVPDLTADDFQVKLDGSLRPVRAVTYERIETSRPLPDVEPATPATSSTRVEGGTGTAAVPARHRVIVVFVDDLSLTPSRGKSMLQGAARFVQNLPPGDLVGYATSSGSEAMNPTADHLAVQVALPKLVGSLVDPRDLPGPPVGIDEGIQIADGDAALLDQVIARDCYPNATAPTDPTTLQNTPCGEDVGRKARQVGELSEANTYRQIQAYLAAVNGLKSLPGIKQLVAISDGLGLVRRTQSAVALEPLAKAAAAAGVQVTVMSEEPSGVDLSEINRTFATATGSAVDASTNATVRRADNIFLQQGVETVADMTGGAFYRVVGTPDSFYTRVALATSGLYELGVAAPDKSQPGRDFALSVHVNRPGLTVYANHHALIAAPAPPVPVETQLKDAVANGTPLYGIPISMGTSVRRADVASQVAVNLDIDVPASTPGPLTLMFGLSDPIGMAQSGRKVLDAPSGGGDYRVSLTIPVAPGTYTLRLAAADANGAVGSVQTRVKAVLSQMGPFLVSDLLTGWSAGSGPAQFLALERLPATATELLGVLELYPAPGATIPADVKVRETILTPDGTPVDDREVVPQDRNGMLRAEAPFDLQYIPAGPYVLRATVTAGGGTVGTTSTTIQLSGPPGQAGFLR